MVEEDLKKRKEELDKRPQKMRDRRPDVVIDLALNTLSNGKCIKELSVARASELHYLILMGVHACIVTINKYIFGKVGKAAFKDYLKRYVDGKGDDFRFSKYSDMIYDRRNDLAHQLFSKTGHSFGFDSKMKEGILEKDGIVLINTVAYFDHFKSAFEMKSKRKTKESIFDVLKSMSLQQQREAKKRIVENYK